MKKAKLVLATLVAVALVMGASTAALAREREFKDLEGYQWAEKSILKMQLKTVIKGMADGTFAPQAPIKQQDAVVMAVRLMGLEPEAQTQTNVQLPFSDASAVADYAANYVALALQKGLIPPTAEFQPEKAASRLWVTVLLVKALGAEADAQAKMNAVLNFKDASAIGSEYTGYVAVAVEKGIVRGYSDDNTFRPNKPVTRAEMAALMDRLDENRLSSGVEPREKDSELDGTVKAVTPPSLVVTTHNGDVTVVTDVYTKTFIDEKEATLAEIQVGSKVEIELTDGVAALIDAEAAEAEKEKGAQGQEGEIKGTISSLDAANGSVTITTDAGPQTFPLAQSAELKLDGKVAALADLAAGLLVEIKVVDGQIVKLSAERAENGKKGD